MADLGQSLETLFQYDLGDIEKEQRKIQAVHTRIRGTIEETAKLAHLEETYVLRLAAQISHMSGRPWHEVIDTIHLFYLYQEYDQSTDEG